MSDDDKLLDHNYDGIQEYDNDLPRWWLSIFAITTILAWVYVVYVHTGMRPSDDELLKRAMASLEESDDSSDPAATGAVAEEGSTLLAQLENKVHVESGKEIFVKNCVACHSSKGEGLIGPNLTDPFWIHGGSPEEIHRIIVEGVVEKGMISWKTMLTDDQIRDVTAFVWSIRNDNVEGKAPEGERVNLKEASKEVLEFSLKASVNDQKRVDAGKEVFIKNCVACHGAKGEGLVGPNLTDAYWIHGGTLEDIHALIVKGVPEKGMISWKAMLKKKEIEDVSLYIWSIRNNKENGKAPEGEEMKG